MYLKLLFLHLSHIIYNRYSVWCSVFVNNENYSRCFFAIFCNIKNVRELLKKTRTVPRFTYEQK